MPVSSGSGLADPERNPFSPNCYQRKLRYRITLLAAGKRLQESEWIQGSSGDTRREGGKAMRGNIVRTGGFLAASLVLLAAFASAGSGAGFAEPKVEFSADNYVTAEDGKEFKYKMYQAPDKQRMDFEEGGKQSMIIRPDKKVSWVVMPQEKMYLEMSLEEGKAKGPGARSRPARKWSTASTPREARSTCPVPTGPSTPERCG